MLAKYLLKPGVMAIPIIFAFIFPETVFAFLLLVGSQRIMISKSDALVKSLSFPRRRESIEG